MPWNESHLDIRSDHLDPSTCDRQTIHTIAISEADGIDAVVGKPPGRDYELTLSFLFAKSKGWTGEKAKDWFKEHEHTADMPLGYWPVGGSAALNSGGRLMKHDLVTGRKMDVKCFTNNEGKRFILTDDCKNIIATQCASATGCSCDPSRCPRARAFVAGRRFDPTQATVGDLVGKNVNDSRMQIDASALSDSSSRRLGVVQAMISSKAFDPMQPTIGDLVGSKTVEAAVNSPPVTHRINGKLDLSQPTVGDLSVRGHTSGRTISAESDDFLVHPSRVKEVSR